MSRKKRRNPAAGKSTSYRHGKVEVIPPPSLRKRKEKFPKRFIRGKLRRANLFCAKCGIGTEMVDAYSVMESPVWYFNCPECGYINTVVNV